MGSVGRPQTRWTDDIQRYAGKNWIQTTQQRPTWKSLEDGHLKAKKEENVDNSLYEG